MRFRQRELDGLHIFVQRQLDAFAFVRLQLNPVAMSRAVGGAGAVEVADDAAGGQFKRRARFFRHRELGERPRRQQEFSGLQRPAADVFDPVVLGDHGFARFAGYGNFAREDGRDAQTLIVDQVDFGAQRHRGIGITAEAEAGGDQSGGHPPRPGRIFVTETGAFRRRPQTVAAGIEVAGAAALAGDRFRVDPADDFAGMGEVKPSFQIERRQYGRIAGLDDGGIFARGGEKSPEFVNIHR
ncbi:hypothetical protein SDC9_136732 [bioreactor metagenome]|uniref:Uncharacterized protein n=1 Tax=bioreactor metagenome TaxID=1076179 RepID=A0A645DJJ6_9ZZZZ